MSKTAVETFCRALNEMQSRTANFAKSNKELLFERKEMRATLLELLPKSSCVNAGACFYSKKMRNSYKALTEGRVREAIGRVFSQQQNQEELIEKVMSELNVLRKNEATCHLIRSKTGSSTGSGGEQAQQLVTRLAAVEDQLAERRVAFNLATLELKDSIKSTRPKVLQFLRRGRESPVTKNVSLSGGGGFATRLKLKTYYKRKSITNPRLKVAIAACYQAHTDRDSFIDAILDHLARDGATLDVKISNRRVTHELV